MLSRLEWLPVLFTRTVATSKSGPAEFAWLAPEAACAPQELEEANRRATTSGHRNICPLLRIPFAPGSLYPRLVFGEVINVIDHQHAYRRFTGLQL